MVFQKCIGKMKTALGHDAKFINWKNKVAIAINSEISMLYWRIGKKIVANILKHKRAEYGQEIIETLSPHRGDNYHGHT